MDDSASVDLVDVSPIGSPDHFQITGRQLWSTEKSRSDAENEDICNVANDSDHRPGSPQWLPYPPGGFRKLKPLTLETNLPPPFLLSPGYPSTVESTPSPSGYIPDYFDIRSEDLLPPAKVDDDMGFYHYPHLSIYDPEDFDEDYAWDLHSRFSISWDAGDDSDGSEPSDEPADYITFTGQSASIPPEFELGVRQFDLSEPRSFVLDFPEDVGESLDHDIVLAEGDSGVIARLGRSAPLAASEIPVELSVQPHDDFQTLSVYTPNILSLRMRKLSEDSSGLGSVLCLSYPGLDVTDVPVNVPVSPLITDGFPDDTIPLYSDLVGDEVEEISMDTDWLGSLGEIVCSPCLDEGLMEWNRWRGQLVEELDRDLGPWAEVRERVRTELDRL